MRGEFCLADVNLDDEGGLKFAESLRALTMLRSLSLEGTTFFRLWDGGDCAALCEGGVYAGLGLRLLFEVGVGCAAELLVALRLLRWSDHYYYPAPTRIGTSIRILTLVSIGTAISIRARIPG